jgi:hypothetical protein
MSIYPNDYCHECQKTPSVEQPAPPNCSGEKCVEIYDASCIRYSGAPIECRQIETGDRLEEVIHKLGTCYNEEFVRGLLRMIRDNESLKTLFAQIVCSVDCNTITLCDIPSGIVISNVTATGATVSWAKIAGVSGYYLELKETSGEYTQIGGLIANPSGSTVSVNITGLNGTSDFLVRLKTVCSDGSESSWSEAIDFTTLTPVTPATCDAPSTPTLTFS